MRSALTRIIVLACVAALSGCSWFGWGKSEDLSKASGDRLFKEAKEALNGGDYNRAIKLYESLEAKFPYGVQAQQAMLDAAWANYKIGEYATAVGGADRFIKLHPAHQNVDYAYYLKGLALFGEEFGIFAFLGDQDISERDAKSRRESYVAFKEIVERFADSPYAGDARLRMRYLVNSLGEYEMHVARYYFNRGAYVAAINRAQLCVSNYPATPSNEEALWILAQSHLRMGNEALSKDAMRVLERSFPKSRFIGGGGRSWWKIWG